MAKAPKITTITKNFKIEVNVTDADADDIKPPQLSAPVNKSFAARPWILRKSDGDENSSEDKRQIMCVAMVANEIDAHGDLFTPEAVEQASVSFLKGWNVTKDIGRQHRPDDLPDIELIGSWYTEQGGKFDELEAPAHSWVVKMEILDDETWAQVKAGQLTGVSIEGECIGYQVEKAIRVQKSEAGEATADSEEPTPNRVFVGANPARVDVVDGGANLKVLVWKQASNTQAEEIQTMAQKNEEIAEKPSAEKPELVQTEARKSESKVADEQPAAKPASVENVESVANVENVEKAKSLTPKRRAKFKELQAQVAALAEELGIDDEDDDADEPAAETVQKSKNQPDPSTPVLENLTKALVTLNERLETLEHERSGPSVGEGDGSEPANKGPFGGAFKGLFG